MTDGNFPNDGFNILIDAKIDEAGSKQKILNQLKKMQEGLSVNLNMQIDPDLLKSIKAFSDQMEKVSAATLKQLNYNKEIITVNKELDGTIQKISQRYMNEQKIHEEIITTTKKQKQLQQEILDATQKQGDKDRARLEDLNKIGRKIQEITHLNQKLEPTGKTTYYRQNDTKSGTVQVQTDASGNVTSAKIVDNIEKEEQMTRKLIKAKEELTSKLMNLKQVGQISAKTLESVGASLTTSKSQEELDELSRKMKTLEATSKQMANNQGLQFVNEKKIAEQAALMEKLKEKLKNDLNDLRQVAQVSEKTLNGVGDSIDTSKSVEELRELEKRMKDLQKVSQQMNDMDGKKFLSEKNSKEQNEQLAHRVKLYQQEMAIKLQDTKTRYSSVLKDGELAELEKLSNRMKSLTTQTPKLEREIQQLNVELRQLQANARENSLDVAAKKAQTFGDMISQAMVKFPIWMAASTAFYQSLRFFSDGIAYVVDLNKALTEISIVTGRSQASVEELGQSYQKLAMDMSVTTKEIAQASVEFYRQGLNDAEVMEKMEVAVQYAKISSLEFNQAATILTATVNSMGISAERASDVFSYLGDATATGADEIGIAFQKVGGTAGATGVEFEKMASWIAVVSSRTRESAETIGDAMKSILARVQSLKEGGFDSVLEDGTSANQVQKALSSVGVQLIDSNKQFRDFGTVMDELGAKWGGLDKTTRAYIATTVAGTYQQSRFLNLMEGYPQSVDLYKNALDSAGTTTQKFALYQDSTEAAVNRLKTAYTGLWQDSFNSEGLRDLINALTVFVEIIDKVVEVVGIMPLAMGALGTAVALMSKNFRAAAIDMITFRTATLGASEATIALKASIRGLLASTLVGAAIAVLGIVVEKLISYFADASDQADNFNNKLRETYQQAKTNTPELQSLADQYAQLQASSDGSVESQQQLQAVRDKLAQSMPEIVKHYDAEGKAVYATAEEVQGLVQKYKELNAERAKTIADSMLSDTDEDSKALTDLYEKRKKMQSEFNKSTGDNQAAALVSNFMDEVGLSGFEQGSQAYKDRLKALQNTQDYMDKLKKLKDDISLTYANAGKNVSGNQFVVYALEGDKSISQMVEEQADKLGQAKTQLDSIQEEITEHQKKFLEGFQANNEYMLKDNTDKNVELLFDNLAANFVKANEITDENRSEMISKYKTLSADIYKAMQDQHIDMSRLFETNDFSTMKLVIQNITSQLGGFSVDAAEVMQTFDQSTEAATQSVYSLDDAIKGMKASYESAATNMSVYNKLLQQNNSEKGISIETVVDLIDKNADYIDLFEVENGYIKLNTELLKKKRETEIEGFKTAAYQRKLDLMSENEAMTQKMKNWDLQIQSITTIAELEAAKAKANAEAQKEYLATLPDGQVENQHIINQLDKVGKPYDDMLDKIYKLNKEYDLYAKSLETVGQETKETKKETQDTTDVLSALAKKLNEVDRLINKAENAASKYAKSSKEYRKALGEEVSLLEKKIKLLDQGIANPESLMDVKVPVDKDGNVTSTSGSGSDTTSNGNLQEMFQAAESLKGTFKYVFGGGDDGDWDAFVKGKVSDCSALVQQFFKEFLDLDVGRTTLDQYNNKNASKIDKENLQVGDLVFFNTTGREHSHVGIYQGGGKFLQIGEKSGLSTQDMNNSYWSGKYDGAVRFNGVTGGGTSGAAYSGKYEDSINAAASKYGVDPQLIAAVIQQESNFGANGITNVMQVNGMNGYSADASIDAGSKMLKALLEKAGGDVSMALGGYNMGEGIINEFKKNGGYSKSVMEAYSKKYDEKYAGDGYGDVGYVDKIMSKYSGTGTGSGGSGNAKGYTQDDLDAAVAQKEQEKAQAEQEIMNKKLEIINSYTAESQKKVTELDKQLEASKRKQGQFSDTSPEYRKEEMSQSSIATKKQAELHKQAETIRTLAKKYGIESDELDQQLNDLSSQWMALQDDKLAHVLKIATSQVDEYDKKIDKVKNDQDAAQKRAELFDEDSADYRKELEKQIPLIEKQKKLTQSQINTLETLMKSERLSAAAKEEYSDKLAELNLQLLDYEASIKDVNEEIRNSAEEEHSKWVDKTKDAIDKVKDAIKEYYEKSKDIAVDAIDAQIDAEDKRHDKVMDNLDAELDKYQKTIETIMNLNDEAAGEEDYESNLRDKQDEINELKSKRAEIALVNTPDGKAQAKDYDEQIADKEKELAQFKLERMRETTKQGLENLKNAKSDEVDVAKDAEDEQNKATKERLDKQKKETEDYWQAKIDDDQYFLQVENDIFNNNAEGVKHAMSDMVNDVTSNMSALGEGIRNNLTNELQNALDLLSKVQYGADSAGGSLTGDDYKDWYDANSDSSSSGSKSGGVLNTSNATSQIMSAFSTYVGGSGAEQKKALATAKQLLTYTGGSVAGTTAKYSANEIMDFIKAKPKGWESIVKDELKRASLVYFIDTASGDSAGAKAASTWATKIRNLSGIQSFDTGGYTGDFEGGKLAVLHKKEYILNQDNFDSVLASVEMANKVVASAAKIDYSRLPTTKAAGGSQLTIENLMNIDQFQNTSGYDIKTIVKQVANELMKTLAPYGIL